MSAVVREVTEARIDELWHWLVGALFLLVAVDTLLTLVLAATVGPHHEANPVVRWLLVQGPAALVVANLLAAVVVAVLFHAILDRLAATPAPLDRYFALLVEAWVGVLLAVGLAVFANNLAVLVLGSSLL